MCVWDRHGRLDGKLRRRGCWAMLVMIYPCQEKFEGIHNNIFTEVSTSKEKHFSCVDFIGANVLAPPPPPASRLLSAEAAKSLMVSHTHTHTHVHTQEGRRMVSSHGGVHLFDVSHTHTHTHTHHTQEGRRYTWQHADHTTQ